MDALLRSPGEGEVISDEPEREVRIKADREELTLTESRYAAGESGPGPHVHRDHADCFWVLDGELTFELGQGELVRVDAGGLVLVPPEVVHTFRNEGPGEARFLNAHAPSKGFGDHLRAMRDGRDEDAERFDTFNPPADGGRPASDAHVLPAGDGERSAVGGSSVVFKAGREHGGGWLSLTETTLAPRFPGPVPHRHETFVDSFWVLEGTLGLQLGDRTLAAEPGSYALASPGTVHTFSNTGDEPVRMLNLMAPGGFERYLKEVAAAVPADGAVDQEVMARLASRHDFHPA